MSRRNSASRRRSYGRRLHEVNERRHGRRGERLVWPDDADTAGDTASGGEMMAFPDWLRDGREGAQP